MTSLAKDARDVGNRVVVAGGAPLALLAGVAGGMLLAWGSRRRGASGRVFGVSGALLLAASLVAGERARHGRARPAATGRVRVPQDRVFEFWSHYEDEPAAPHRTALTR